MKNFWGQDIFEGSVVGVGYRRTGAQWRQIGVVVRAVEKEVAWPRGEKHWFATVVWIAEDRGKYSWYDGPTFVSQWDVRDLLAVEETSLDPGLQASIREAWQDWQVRHTKQSDWALA